MSDQAMLIIGWNGFLGSHVVRQLTRGWAFSLSNESPVQ